MPLVPTTASATPTMASATVATAMQYSLHADDTEDGDQPAHSASNQPHTPQQWTLIGQREDWDGDIE